VYSALFRTLFFLPKNSLALGGEAGFSMEGRKKRPNFCGRENRQGLIFPWDPDIMIHQGGPRRAIGILRI